MIQVHPNGDMTIPGPRVALTMYRHVDGERYEPAFDEPCEWRMFLGQHKTRFRPTAFYWGCRPRGTTTSISACRECPVTESEKECYRELARSKSYVRSPGPPTESDRVEFLAFLGVPSDGHD